MITVPFHLSTIPKPQDTYKIRPDNSNTPFVGTDIPPELTSFSAEDLIDQPTRLGSSTPVSPESLESTPFTFIDTLDGLDVLRAKLSRVDEFAVDLEANSYRSFQGLTCLMQISTRSEDFVVDTLKLHSSIGPYLGNLFLDPTKRKVMHGAGNDILWLQRDFGVYVCNMFDTMQASRVLKLERNSLQHLLVYFCGVLANKQYQTSDWRIRPLPSEMLHYAREDTHYLLYIYDKMRSRLVSGGGFLDFEDPLLEVYKRSHEVCSALYEKELFSEDSYKSLFGLGEAGLNPDQVNVVARLYKWRDQTARGYDESIGYVMPNKLLLELSQKLPKTRSQLLSIIGRHSQNHPFIVENIVELMNIIGNVSQVDNNANKRSRMMVEMQYIPEMRRPQGFYSTTVYPQACFINAVIPPGYYVPAKRPAVMNRIYCPAPNYYRYQIC